MTQAFNLSQLANNLNTSGQLDASDGLFNQVPVPNGGTGASTLASGAVLLGAGTSAITTVSAATSGNVLTANGTTWVSQAASGGTPVVTIYTSPATWTKPATVKFVRVSLVAGGGGGGGLAGQAVLTGGGGGGAGGVGFFPAPSIPGPQAITSGVGGAGGVRPGSPGASTGSTGGTASFGTLISATGGSGGGGASVGSPGSITPSPTVVGSVGTPGYAGAAGPTSNLNVGGAGGDSFLSWGRGGDAKAGPNFNGNPGVGYGGGGGGSGAAPTAGGVGGNGSSGYVIVEEFY